MLRVHGSEVWLNPANLLLSVGFETFRAAIMASAQPPAFPHLVGLHTATGDRHTTKSPLVAGDALCCGYNVMFICNISSSSHSYVQNSASFPSSRRDADRRFIISGQESSGKPQGTF
jgi:hypothetical protein